MPEEARVISGNGGTQRLIHQLPYAIAMELLLAADSIDVEQALRWGLINQVVPAASDVLPARGPAERIARNAPLAVQATKELAVRSCDVSLAEGQRMEQTALRLLAMTDDTKEGSAAFAEKRAPTFTGR